MKIDFHKSLQFRILLITVMSLLPYIGFTIYNAEADRKQGIDDLKKEALQLVNFTLVDEARTIDGSRQLLISLSNLANEYHRYPARCKVYLSNLLTKLKRYVNLGIVNKNGFLIASGNQFESKIDYSHSEFYREVMQNGEFSVGEYFVDPVSNKRIINLGYPILDDKKRIKAVIFASLDVAYIDIIEKNLAKIFHEKSLFIKIDNEGDILATNSTSNELIKSIIKPLLLKRILRQETGIIETSGSRNQKYLLVFAATESNLIHQKLCLIVGVNKEEFFSGINKTLYRNLFLIGVLFFIVLVSAFIFSDKYILKIVKKLILAINERAAGNLQFRSNVDYNSGELGQLAMSFDNMADTLEKHNNDRIKVENSLRESEERFRNLFEHSPVSLWWEDHSEIKKYIDQLRAAGVKDFRAYFQINPNEVAKCVTMLEVIAVNETTLQLYDAKSKEDLLEGLVKIFKKESYRVFTEELIALTTGKTEYECEASTQTLTGKMNYVIFKLLILPGYEETWSKVLVSMTDITERKRAEAQILFQASLLEQVANGVAVADMEGKLIYWNRYAEILHGWNAEEVLGKSVLEFLVSEKQKKFAKELINSIFLKDFAEVEISLMKKDGAEFPAHVSYSVLRNVEGEPSGILGISIDISERNKMLNSLRESRDLFFNTISSLNDAIFLINPESRLISDCNVAAEKIFGYMRAEIINQTTLFLHVDKNMYDEFGRRMNLGLEENGFFQTEFKAKRKNGEIFTTEHFVRPLLDKEGKIIMVLSVLRDITNRKKAQELIKYQASLFENVHDAILATDKNFRITAWNLAAEELYGWKAHEVLGKIVYEIIHSEFTEELRSNTLKLLSEGKYFSAEEWQRRKDERAILVEGTTMALFDEQNNITGYVSMNRDITDRSRIEKEKEELLLKVQKTSDQLKTLSRQIIEVQELEKKRISQELHDEIGQTLTAAKINLQSIQKTNKSNKIRKELDIPISYIAQSLQQVRDISLNLRPSVLDDLGIEAALKWLINRFIESTKINCELQFVAEERIPSKELDITCYRITQEALTNIVKYADAKNVIVFLTIEDNSLQLKITDDGRGFDVEDARKQALKGKSLGILSMEERAKLAGGEFNIISSEKSGTEVEAIIPLPKS